MPQSLRSQIGSWLLATAIIGAGAVYVYYVYGDVIQARIQDIQDLLSGKTKIAGSLSDNPIFGNKNPVDQLIQKKNSF
jgi:hypothetical protein